MRNKDRRTRGLLVIIMICFLSFKFFMVVERFLVMFFVDFVKLWELKLEPRTTSKRKRGKIDIQLKGWAIVSRILKGRESSSLLFYSLPPFFSTCRCCVLFYSTVQRMLKSWWTQLLSTNLFSPTLKSFIHIQLWMVDFNGIINSKIPRCHFLSHFRAMLTLISKSLVLYFQHEFVLQAKIDKILLFSFEFSSCLYHHSSEKAHQLKVWAVASRKSLYRSSLPFSLFHDSA